MNFLVIYGSVKSPDNGPPRNVRCSALMDAHLDEAAPPAYIGGVKDSIRALAQMMEAIAPGADAYVFTRRRSYVRILHQNDYIIEKAIVCCVFGA